MFLSMWDALTGEQDDPEQYFGRNIPKNAAGMVQPFTDSPLDKEMIGETIYMGLINRATRYVYITTPYLILDNEMVTALTASAQSGVDVRIITPHVADKWYVHAVTRAYYETLIEKGVKIYEYTPGFIHAKTIVADDRYAVIGTINFDYRSLYLHFECGVFLYRTECIEKIRSDYERTLSESQQIMLADSRQIGLARHIIRSILRVFAPLM